MAAVRTLTSSSYQVQSKEGRRNRNILHQASEKKKGPSEFPLKPWEYKICCLFLILLESVVRIWSWQESCSVMYTKYQISSKWCHSSRRAPSHQTSPDSSPPFDFLRVYAVAVVVTCCEIKTTVTVRQCFVSDPQYRQHSILPPPPTLYCSPSKQPPTHQHSYWDLLILQVAVQTSGSPANSDRQCDLDMFWGSDFPMAAKLFAASSRTLESESDLLAINNGWHILQTPATIHVLQLCYSSSILVGTLTLLQSIQTKSIKQLLKMHIKKLNMEILARFGKEPLAGASMLSPMNLGPAKIPAYQWRPSMQQSLRLLRSMLIQSYSLIGSLPWTTSVFQPSCASFKSHQPHFVAEASSQRWYLELQLGQRWLSNLCVFLTGKVQEFC